MRYIAAVLTAILVALLAIQSAPARQRNETRSWYQAYADAQRHIQQENWLAAVHAIWIAKNRGKRPGRRVHFYGLVWGEFNPDYYLGVAYLNLNRYDDADSAFERVRQAQLIGPRDRLYAEFMRQTMMVSQKQAASQPPANAWQRDG